jgi:hypothetical protein
LHHQRNSEKKKKRKKLIKKARNERKKERKKKKSWPGKQEREKNRCLFIYPKNPFSNSFIWPETPFVLSRRKKYSSLFPPGGQQAGREKKQRHLAGS